MSFSFVVSFSTLFLFMLRFSFGPLFWLIFLLGQSVALCPNPHGTSSLCPRTSWPFQPWHHGSWPPTWLGVCFVLSNRSPPVTHPILILRCHLLTLRILLSPNPIEPLLDLLIFRPPLSSTSLHAASLQPMVVPPVVGSIPATLSASALLRRPTVTLLASRPPLFPLLVVLSCSSSLISPLSSVGCHVKSVSWGVVLLFLLLLFSCSRSTSQPLLRCMALLSAPFTAPPSS